MFHLNPDEIGGGKVRRRFSSGERVLTSGQTLTGDEVRAIPASNRRALIENRFLEVWRKDASAPTGLERRVIHLGRGRYNVIEARTINAAPMTKDEAMALAGLAPSVKPKKGK